MHDVLDPRDLVPDEAEQLLHSGHLVGALLDQARAAAAADDLDALGRITVELRATPRAPTWDYEEPDDDASLLDLLSMIDDEPAPADHVADRVYGAWLGRCVANTMGKPVEGLTRSEVRIYLEAVGQWPQTGYLPLLDELPPGVSHLHESAPFATAGNFEDVPRDDDLDWTILALTLVEEHGNALTTADVAAAWLDRLPFTQTFTAERAAYRNLVRGVAPLEAATVDNPYREWIGALIRADLHGMVRPGAPAAAARAALVDARLSHVGNGIYGETWAAALVASALVASSPLEAVQRANAAVPSGSRLREALDALLALRATGASANDALDWVDQHLGHYNWVHTINNAALITIGLLWGESFLSAVTLTISGGRDTDSSAATVGSVWGALHGSGTIPAELVGTTHVRVRSAVSNMDRVSIAELAARTTRLTEEIA